MTYGLSLFSSKMVTSNALTIYVIDNSLMYINLIGIISTS